MSAHIEIHTPPEAKTASIELLKRRDAKLVKKAIGRSASKSLKAKSVREHIAQQNIKNGVELEKQQLATVQKALGKMATEKGITKLPQRFRSRRLKRKIDYARKELG